MSYHEYQVSNEIARYHFPFYALIMAAMRQADTPNTAKLRAMWPEVWTEMDARYHAPGGWLASDRPSEEPGA